MSLHDALVELAEPFLSARTDVTAVVASVRARLTRAETALASDARGRRARARAVHEQLLALSREVNAEIEAAVDHERLRLTPLAMALDWLVHPAPEASLTRELALLPQAEPIEQRLGEVVGVLGSVREEAQALAGEAALQEAPSERTPEKTLEALVRVRLARVGMRVDRWIEAHTRGSEGQSP